MWTASPPPFATRRWSSLPLPAEIGRATRANRSRGCTNSESTKLLILQSKSLGVVVTFIESLCVVFSIALARQLQAEEDAHARAVYEEHYRRQYEQRVRDESRHARSHGDGPEEVKKEKEKEKKKSDCIIM
jgi:hypothetical protein